MLCCKWSCRLAWRPCQSARFPSAEANVTGSGRGQHCESEGLFIAEIRANVQVRNPVASHSTRQPDAIDLTDFLLMLPNSHFSWVGRSSRSLETRQHVHSWTQEQNDEIGQKPYLTCVDSCYLWELSEIMCVWKYLDQCLAYEINSVSEKREQ